MLKGEKIRLRAVEPSDALMMYEVENDPEVWFYSSRIAPLSMNALSRYACNSDSDPFRERQLRLVVELLDDTPCGLLDLYEINPVDRTAMVGIVILSQFRGQGLASEALSLLQSYADRVLHLRALAARIATTNSASMRLFLSAGYSQVGLIPDWLISPDGEVDMAILWRSIQK